MSWLIPKTGTGLSEKVSIVEHDSFHNDCHPLPLFRRKYDLEQKGIGMYYEMPTTRACSSSRGACRSLGLK